MTSPLRRSGPRWARIIAATTTVGIVANGLRLRKRAEALTPLPTDRVPDSAAVDANRWRTITAVDAVVDSNTIEDVIRHAEAQGLDAVDVVPADLPTERFLDLTRQVDPDGYRSDPLLEGRTAGHAVVVREEIAKRAGLPDGPITAGAMIDLAREVKRFAPRSHDFVVAPNVSAVAHSASDRRAVQHATFDRYSSLALSIPAFQLASLAAGAVIAPPLGITALAAYLAQPSLVFAGRPAGAGPRDLARQRPRRWVTQAQNLIGTAGASAPPPATTATADELRPLYHAELAEGLGRFFEKRRTDCPWCGSGTLVLKVVSPDLIQHKPGEFHLEECRSCGHIFQNPRLSLEGLDFYYRDFYDGYGGGEMERIFAAESQQYDGRVDMVADHTDGPPSRWLDVGTGHGHFCLVAQGRWPDTEFDGADMGSAVEEAADRGWIHHGHRGLFPELAASLVDHYDVVSMHHYLEHTRDPKAELDAAAVVLAPGGHLLIEVPDPECTWGRILGSRWLPWFQPQHQHFVSIDNLESALRERGFTPVARHRARSNQALDLVAGIWLSLGQLAPRPGMPWLGPATMGQRAWRTAVCTVAMPVMITVALVDKVLDKVADPGGVGNTYRVLARLDTGSDADPT